MKWLVVVTSNVGAGLGWWAGAKVGFMTAFVVSMIGMGLGIYGGRRWGQHIGL